MGLGHLRLPKSHLFLVARQTITVDIWMLFSTLPLWNIWKSVGMITNIWKSKKCSKPPTRYVFCLCLTSEIVGSTRELMIRMDYGLILKKTEKIGRKPIVSINRLWEYQGSTIYFPLIPRRDANVVSLSLYIHKITPRNQLLSEWGCGWDHMEDPRPFRPWR